MQFLYLLEKIRIPGLNELMLLITRLGEETAFLVVAMIVFWCIDKRHGYYVLSVGFVGTITNQFMKLFFRIPRPWVLDSNFTILEQAREAASGYSFTSGHSQSAVGTFGTIATVSKKKWIRVGCIAVAVLVPFSRMYIGVHTPKDVLVAAATAVLLIVVMRPVIYKNDGKYIPVLLAVMTAVAAGYLAYVELYPFPADIDPHNLESGLKNAYTLFGSLTGLIAVYIADEKKLNFSTDAIWWAQILKVICGLLLVLAVKEGLRSPLEALIGSKLIARAIRYFLIVIMAGIVWPLSFRWFSKLGRKDK